jgi:hypothetical protein
MKNEFKRKEVWLHEKVIDRLEKLAGKKKWSLKSYMEHVLSMASNRQFKK